MNNANTEIFIYLITLAVLVGGVTGGMIGHAIGVRQGMARIKRIFGFDYGHGDNAYGALADHVLNYDEDRLGHEESI